MKKLLPLLFLCFTFICNAQDVNMQNGSSSQCTGMFYDSGGPSGAPQSNENLIYTFCPDFAEGAIQFDFTFFQLTALQLFLLHREQSSFFLLSCYNHGRILIYGSIHVQH